ncbi:MAG: VapE domain-containing protein [bacterium]
MCVAEYIARGWHPIPLRERDKRPAAKWANVAFAEDDFPKGGNVGINLGMSNLMVLDLDTEAARRVAPLIVPRTMSSSRHADAAHYYFSVGKVGNKTAFGISDEAVQRRFGLETNTDNKTVLVEVLGRGQQVMAPPSIHPCGTAVRWLCEDGPSAADAATVRNLGKLVAFAAVVLMAYPKSAGQRDETCLAFSGALLAAGLSVDRTDEIVRGIAELAGDEEYADRGKAQGTAAASGPTTGLPRLCELLGVEAIENDLRDWLGIGGKSPVVVDAEGWPGGCHSQTGLPFRNHLNTVQAMAGIDVRLNLLSRRPEIAVNGSALAISEYAGDMNDRLVTLIADAIARRYKFDPGEEGVARAVRTLAAQNAYHPVRQWLEGLPPWDRTRRLHDHLVRLFGAVEDGHRVEVDGQRYSFVEFCSTMHWVAAVKRVFEPGTKYDHVLTLEGEGGTGKSSYAAIMAGCDEWFTDQTIFSKSEKEVAETVSGYWVVELAELSGLSRSDNEAAKALITRTADRCRPAYGRIVEALPRQCVFVATTERSDYLRTGGNRRFLPLRITRTLDFQGLQGERPLLFAEALYLYRAGFPTYLPAAVVPLAAAQQAGRVRHAPWEDLLPEIDLPIEVVRGRVGPPMERIRSVAVRAAIEEIAPDAFRFDRDAWDTINQVMQRHGWEKFVGKIGGKTCRGYQRPQAQGELGYA